MATDQEIYDLAKANLFQLMQLQQNMQNRAENSDEQELPPTIEAPDGTTYRWNEFYKSLPEMIEKARKEEAHWRDIVKPNRRRKRVIRGLNIRI